MAELYDVTLGGKGYLVAPKSYRRGMDSPGLLGSAPVRLVQRAFTGGLRGYAERGESGPFSSSLALLPGRTGPGVEAGPKEVTVAGTAHPTARRYACMVGGRPYVATGGELLRLDRVGLGLNPNNMGTPTRLGATFTGDAVGLATNGYNALYVARNGQPFIIWTIGGVAFDTTPTLVFAAIAYYIGALWGGYLNGNDWRIARVTGGSTIDGAGYPVVGQPVAMIAGRDGIYTATPHGLWRTRATVSGTAGNTQDVDHQQLVQSAGSGRPDDWAYLCDHAGDIYAWYNGGVHRYDAAAGTMIPLGLWGGFCFGLASAGGYLIALVYPEPGQVPRQSASVWLWAGAGWWQLTDEYLSANGLVPTGGYLEDATIVASEGGNWRGYQLRPLPAQPGLAPAGELVSAFWPGDDPDAAKTWTKVGAELGGLAYRAFGACTAYLDYSLDGNTWTNVASQAVSSTAPLTLNADLPVGVQAKAILLRYRLSGVTTGAPVLRALWAEYRPIEEVVPKMHWQFDVLVNDGQVLRNSRAEARTGKQIAADLWGQWAARGTLTFRDVDYDLATVTRNVRIVGVDELVERADGRGQWGEAVCRVKLVEV